VLTWGSERESSAMRSHGERLSSQVSPVAVAVGLEMLLPARDSGAAHGCAMNGIGGGGGSNGCAASGAGAAVRG
jgi:hypothetical protein